MTRSCAAAERAVINVASDDFFNRSGKLAHAARSMRSIGERLGPGLRLVEELGQRACRQRGIHNERNHEWAARAKDQVAELAAWLPRRLLDNDDLRQQLTVTAAVSAATGSACDAPAFTEALK